MESELRIDLLGLNHPDHFIQQRAILQHEQVRVENAALRRPHSLTDPPLHFEQLMAGLNQTSFQAVDLVLQFRLRELTFADARTGTVDHQNPSAANAGRNRYAPEALLSL